MPLVEVLGSLDRRTEARVGGAKSGVLSERGVGGSWGDNGGLAAAAAVRPVIMRIWMVS